jgi:tRNA(Ile)-lysidine synthase
MHQRGLGALLTAHHLDDQAETLVMRLNRGSGVRGLAGMRRKSKVPGYPDFSLLRPLLSWRRAELERVCSEADVEPVADPSNLDERFERIRIRQALAAADWLDPDALARSAENLAWSDEALEWASGQVWAGLVEENDNEIVYRDPGAPRDILRRIVAMAIARLGNEGEPDDLRGRELDRLLSDLAAARTTTLRGVRCSGGPQWTFSRAAPRSR